MSDKEKKVTSLEDFARQAAARLQSGEELSGKEGVLAPLIKQIIEASLEGELDAHLEKEKASQKENRRNGKKRKKLKTEFGQIELENSRDRASSFEPQLVKKRQTSLGAGLDTK